MLRIVASQLKLNALTLFTLFVVSNVAYLFRARLGFLGYGAGALHVGIGTAAVMIVALLLRHQQIKGDMIYRSLPLRHSSVVSAMFVLVFTILITNLAYGFSVEVINLHIAPWLPERIRSWRIQHLFEVFDSGYAVEHSMLARALAFTIVTSVSIPLIIRYGTMWRMLLGFLIVVFAWAKAVNYLLHFSLYTSFSLGLSRWTFFAIVLMMMSLGLSWRISVWLYGRREF